MTALSDAVHAGQTRAIDALGKAYVLNRKLENDDDDNIFGLLTEIGATDKDEQAQLLSCWKLLRELGSIPPVSASKGTGSPETAEKASQAQLDLIGRLCREKGFDGPTVPLTKAKAHEVIDSLKAGTYKDEPF